MPHKPMAEAISTTNESWYKKKLNNNIDDDDDDNNEIHLSTLMNLNYVVITVRVNKKKKVRATHIVFFI